MVVRKSRKKSAGSLKTLFYGKNKYIDKAISDSCFRLQITAALGGGWNFIYALFHLVMAVYFRSYWFLTMGVYYLVICGMRASALYLKPDKENHCAERHALKRNALLTFFLTVVFSGIVCLTIMEKHNQVYTLIVALAMATYTFYYVVTAILNLTRLKKEKTIQEILLRNCSMVYAIGSLFGLERMMLGTFGNAEDPFTLIMEALSGAGFTITILAFGINLLLLSKKQVAR